MSLLSIVSRPYHWGWDVGTTVAVTVSKKAELVAPVASEIKVAHKLKQVTLEINEVAHTHTTVAYTNTRDVDN
ncbi:MAG: hypothetical protein Aurels2KO_57520 [Aureliella sp.]